MRTVKWGIAVVCGLMAAGCATPVHVMEARNDIIGEVHTGTNTVLTAVDKHDKGDHAGVTKTAQQYAADVEVMKKQLADEMEKLKAAQIDINDITSWVQTGLGTAAQIASADYGGALKTVNEAWKAHAQTRAEAAAAKKETDDLIAKRHKEALKEVKETRTELKADLEKLRELYTTLSTDTQAKLASFDPARLQDLIKLHAADPAKLKLEVLSELDKLGVNAEDRKKLEGLSTEELIALLIAAGAGAGGGGLLSKVGKSREHDKVEELNKRVAKVEGRG